VRKILKLKNIHIKSESQKKTPFIEDIKESQKEIIIGSEKNIPYKI